MHYYFAPIYSPFAPALMLALLPLFVFALLWTVIIKGYALWYAARGNQVGWFVALLVVNTLGILEIIYLIWFRPGASLSRRSEPNSKHQLANKSKA